MGKGMTTGLFLAGIVVALTSAADITVPDGLLFEVDVPYGMASERQRLDILYRKDGGAPQPAIIHIHGGGWYTGGKGGERTFAVLQHFAEAGYVALSIEYRLSDDVKFPAAVEDCKLAVRWLRAHADRYGVDPDHIGAIGASAGGHLSAMLAVAGPAAGLEGDGPWQEYSSAVQAVVPVAAPFDLQAPLSLALAAEDDPIVVRFLGGSLKEKADAARKGSPVTYVRKELPPMLILQGTADKRVDRTIQADVMIGALAGAGAPHEAIFVEGGKHGMGIAREPEMLIRIVAFFDRYLKAHPLLSASSEMGHYVWGESASN